MTGPGQGHCFRPHGGGGTELRLDERLLLATTEPANLSWHRTPEGIRVEAKPPYQVRATVPRPTAIQIGGLTPHKTYAPLINGKKAATALTASAAGVIAVSVKLENRAVVERRD